MTDKKTNEPADARAIEKIVSKEDDTTVFIAEIHRRAETVTPLLKGILEFRPPPHWN